MRYDIKPSPGNDYIHIEVVGEFTAQSFMTCIVESHTLGRELDIHAYLVDVRRARNVDTAFGNFKFAYTDMKNTEGIDLKARVAGLISPGDSSHNFVETVSENAGMFLKLFTDRNAAEQYLKDSRR